MSSSSSGGGSGSTKAGKNFASSDRNGTTTTGPTTILSHYCHPSSCAVIAAVLQLLCMLLLALTRPMRLTIPPTRLTLLQLQELRVSPAAAAAAVSFTPAPFMLLYTGWWCCLLSSVLKCVFILIFVLLLPCAFSFASLNFSKSDFSVWVVAFTQFFVS